MNEVGRRVFLWLHKRVCRMKLALSNASHSSSIFIKTTMIAILIIAFMNFKFGSVAHHHLNDHKYPVWAQKQVSSESTFLNQPPAWTRPPPSMYDRDVLAQGKVKNDTIKRLLKIANDANNVIRRASFDIKLDSENNKGEVKEIVEISPLLFGGFIEHMGRVIDGNFGNDGGIWAELLSDRKFFFDLTPSHTLSSPSYSTSSPWLIREGAGSVVISPKGSPLTLVRGGRVVIMQFPCNSSPQNEEKKENQKYSEILKNKNSLEDDEIEPIETESSDETIVGKWRGEVEQSGLGLNKGRAYRGYVWLSTVGLPDLGKNLKDGSLVGEEVASELSEESSLIVEVWLNIRSQKVVKQKSKLLARISNHELMTMMKEDSREKENYDELNIGEDGSEGKPSRLNNYQGVRSMGRQGKWRRFNFGFEWADEDISSCACGITSQADCAGDCRSGVGSGGFNKQNLNGAKPGVGEDKLGYCGQCGAAITIVGRRVEVNKQQDKFESVCDMSKTNRTILPVPSILIGAVSLMPTDAEHGIFRAETMELLRTLRPTIMRWPGGNFVSGYNWRDGIGPRDARPTRKNAAWAGIVSNDFGVHEFMLLCSLIDALPMIVVNSGLGTAIEAAALVSYVNTPVGQNFLEDHELHISPDRRGPSSSYHGSNAREEAFRRDLRDRLGKMLHEEPRRRARNGEVLPWNCKWWAIGNEMYGEWQLGYAPFNEYRERHKRFAEAMKQVSSDIKLVSVGALHLPTNKETTTTINLEGKDFGFNSSWSGRMMKELIGGHYLDSVSEHFYVDEERPLAALHAKQASWRVTRFASVYRGLHHHLKEFMLSQHMRLPPTFPGICLDEFGYWYGPAEFGQLGTRSSLKDALGVAVAIHAMMRNADVYSVATYSQSVNVFGAIKTTKLSAALDPIGLVLSLYSRVFAHPSSTSAFNKAIYDSNNQSTSRLVEPSFDARSRLNTVEFGAPTAPRIRALSLRGFNSLKLVNIEIEGTPQGYAAGSPIRLVDAIAALRVDQTTSDSPPTSKLTMAFVNLYDANVVSIRMSEKDITSMLQVKNYKLKQKFYQNSIPSLKAKLTDLLDNSFSSEATGEELLVGKCWALHDSCLTDISSPTTMSPSCPDHTAMNTPSSDWLKSFTSNSKDETADMGITSSVVLSSVPPEWIKADNILRIIENPFLDKSYLEKVNEEIEKYDITISSKNEQEKKKNKNKKGKVKRKTPKRLSKASSSSESPPSYDQQPRPTTNHSSKKQLKDDQFLFLGEVSLLPLSATACEFELVTNKEEVD